MDSMSMAFSAFEGSSLTAEQMMNSGVTVATGSSEVNSMIAQSPIRPKAQLLYLAGILGFQVQFTNFPKVVTAMINHQVLMYGVNLFHSFVPDISIAPLQVHFHPEALQTTLHCIVFSFHWKKTLLTERNKLV